MLQTWKGKSFQSLFWYSIVAMLQSIFEQVEFSFVICRTSISDWNFKKSYIVILKYIVLYKKCVVEIIAIRLAVFGPSLWFTSNHFIPQLLSFCLYRDIQISFLFMAKIFPKDEKLIILQYYNLKDWQVTFCTLSIHAQFYASMIFKENFVDLNCI